MVPITHWFISITHWFLGQHNNGLKTAQSLSSLLLIPSFFSLFLFIGNSNLTTLTLPGAVSLSSVFVFVFVFVNIFTNLFFNCLITLHNPHIMEKQNMVLFSTSSSNSNAVAVPRWLEVLLSEKFFNACVVHEEAKKNEKNIFCLDCCFSLCPHCLLLSPHNSHRLLQIRRYVYHDVIRLGDAEKLFDCAFVQSYITNSAKVVFIKQRPQTRQCRGSSNICITCRRALQHPFLFCSIACKIDHILRKNQSGLSNFLLDCKFLALPEPSGFDDGLMTPDSVLEEPYGSAKTSDDDVSGGGGLILACTAATTEVVVRKKRSSVSAAYRASCRPVVCSPVSEISVGLANRRKGTPQRSPLY